MLRYHLARMGQAARPELIGSHDCGRLVAVTALCCSLGVAFGVLTASGSWSAILGGLGFGFVGLVVGVPAAFIINVGRMLG